MKHYILIITVCLAITSCKNQPQTLTKDEVIAFIAKYDSAWNVKDTLTVNSLLGKNYVYFTSKGGLTSRQENLQILGAPYYKIEFAKRDDLEIFIDNNVATVSSRWRGQGLWKDKEFSDNQRCGIILKKENGQLKIVSENCVEIEE